MSTGFSRRRLLSGSAAIALGAVLIGDGDHRDRGDTDRLRAELRAEQGLPRISRPSSVYSFSVERPADLLQLDMSFHGFTKAVTKGVASLVPQAGNVIVVQFPPQAIGEAAYSYATGDWHVEPPPVLSAMSGPSRLCFTTATAIAFTTQTVTDVLDWRDWTLLVPGPAQLNGKVGKGEHRGPTGGVVSTPANPVPGGLTTYIEYPYALFIAPAVDATAGRRSGYRTSFTGRAGGEPLTSPADITDCWTVALQQNEVVSGTARTPELAAIWSSDYHSGDATKTTTIDYKS
jgi:hypothetical protein